MNDDQNNDGLITQIKQFSEKIDVKSQIGVVVPPDFDNLVSEYYEILYDIYSNLSGNNKKGETNPTVDGVEILTNLVIDKLEKNSNGSSLSDYYNLQKLYAFFVKYEKALVVSSDKTQIGLTKSGNNNCFMNASLQMFYHIPEVRDTVLNMENSAPTENEALRSKRQQIKSAFDMLNGKTAQGELSCSLQKGAQHDAHEYIMNDFVPAVLDLQNLKPIFNTEFVTQSSGRKTVTDQPIISAPIISGKSVEEMIISSLKEESDKTVETHGYNSSSRYTRIPETNKYLLIHLKRSEIKLNDEGKAFVENDGTTSSPIKINEMFNTTHDNSLHLPNNKGDYILRGFIEHIGAVSYTHLTLPTNREV